MSLESIACSAATASAVAATARSLSFRHSVVNLRPSSASPSVSPRLSFSISAMKRSPKRLKYSAKRIFKGDGMLYVEADPSGAENWKLDQVVELIKDGAVGVIPTDTVYAIVCDLKSHSAIERLRRIKDIEYSKARYLTEPLSILCHSFRDIDTYTMGLPRGNDHGHTDIFRAVKHCLPGPYTFILPASKELPRQCTKHGTKTKYAARKTVGIRMPDDAICQAILEKLESPLISTSVKWPTKDEWILDPVLIADIYPEIFSMGLDFVVAGGIRVADPSTVVDMTGNYPTIIRQERYGPKLDWMMDKGENSMSEEKELVVGAP
ncbi:hypothetical protein QJS10_CPA16g00968 [Acorus calamus]|uniref:Threonylcarbamoyl-AMP synthase n=1 Tax=Acorus calamus TaxID=4465 RepID=A0AAV9D2A3_ACOCL|nr:hypothetical protein QJS10_CPA16g00968 [Acorus calamus]